MKSSLAKALIFVPGTVWGISFILVELILPFVPPITMTLLRSSISIVMLLVLLYYAKGTLPNSWRGWYPFVILAAINHSIPFALTAWGQTRIDGGLASILLSVMPLFAVLLAFWFTSDEALTPAKLGGVGLGLLGIVVLIGPDALAGVGANLLAQVAVVVAAILYAIGGVYIRRVYPMQPPGLSTWALRLRITTSQFLASVVMLLPFSLWLEAPWTLRPEAITWVYLIALGIGVTGLATLIYFYLIEELGVGAASMTIYLIPVSGVLLGALILHEELTGSMIAALALIFAGIYIASRR